MGTGQTTERRSTDNGQSGKLSDRERQLIAEIKEGYSGRFVDLISPHEEALRSRARRFSLQPADVEDALQQMRMKAFNALSAFRGQSTMRTWLTSILINEVRMLRRKASTRLEKGSDALETQVTSIQGGEQITEAIVQQQIRSKIGRLVGNLPEKYRIVLHLRFTADANVEQTGRLLGISRSAVKSRQHRALKMLRTSLWDRDPGSK